MISAIVSLVLLAVFLFAMAAPVLRKLFRTSSLEELTPEWLAAFSPDSYLVMESLLNREDFKFLSRQPGFDLSLHRKLRRERIDIAQMYLSRMIGDFNRLHKAACLLVAQGTHDQSGVMLSLIWLRVRFSASVLKMCYSLYLCKAGLSVLPVRAVVAHLDAVASQMNALAAAQAS